MLDKPMDVLEAFPVRKTKLQKQDFRDAVQGWLEKQGYSVKVEEGSFGCRNLIAGDPETAKVLVTAHYDTCARLPFPNYMCPCDLLPFLGGQILTWLFLLAVSILVGVGAGLLLGDGWTVPVAQAAVFGFIALMLIGPANPSNVNDNTSGVVTLLEIAGTLPEKQRRKVCFVLFDLEEAGLIGSSSYRKAHKAASDKQIVLNLDCVGDGDHIRLIPNKQLRSDRKKCTSLYKACGYFGKKDILVHETGFSMFPSDQFGFPYGVGICALSKGKFGLYAGKIHTPKDRQLDRKNVSLLRAALVSYISCTEL